jgi:hypothetical protein
MLLTLLLVVLLCGVVIVARHERPITSLDPPAEAFANFSVDCQVGMSENGSVLQLQYSYMHAAFEVDRILFATCSHAREYNVLSNSEKVRVGRLRSHLGVIENGDDFYIEVSNPQKVKYFSISFILPISHGESPCTDQQKWAITLHNEHVPHYGLHRIPGMRC